MKTPQQEDTLEPEERALEGTAIEDAIQQLGTADDDAYVSVTRWSDKDGGWVRVARVPVVGFDSFRIMERLGTGKYCFRLYAGKRLRKQDTLLYEAPEAPKLPVPAPAGDGLNMPALLQLMAQQAQAQQSFQQALIVALVQALGGNVGGGTKGSDLLAAFREGRESAAAGARAATPTEPLLEALRMGFEFANGKDTENGENGMGGLLALAPRVLSLIEQTTSRAPPPQAPRMAGPVPVGPGTGPAPGLSAAPEPAPLAALRSIGPRILDEARAGRDPETWGIWLAERINGETKDQVVQLVSLEPEERRALLLEAVPALSVYMAWVERAVDAIREVLIPVEELEGTDAGSGGS